MAPGKRNCVTLEGSEQANAAKNGEGIVTDASKLSFACWGLK